MTSTHKTSVIEFKYKKTTTTTTDNKKEYQLESKKQFDELLEKNKRVVIDFGASWCGPCKSIAPFYEKISAEYPKIVFVSVDVDDCPEIAEPYNVKSVPTFVFCYRQKVIATSDMGATNSIINDTKSTKILSVFEPDDTKCDELTAVKVELPAGSQFSFGIREHKHVKLRLKDQLDVHELFDSDQMKMSVLINFPTHKLAVDAKQSMPTPPGGAQIDEPTIQLTVGYHRMGETKISNFIRLLCHPSSTVLNVKEKLCGLKPDMLLLSSHQADESKNDKFLHDEDTVGSYLLGNKNARFNCLQTMRQESNHDLTLVVLIKYGCVSPRTIYLSANSLDTIKPVTDDIVSLFSKPIHNVKLYKNQIALLENASLHSMGINNGDILSWKY